MTAVHTSVQTDTISDFLDALAAKIPAPGGGAAAGLHLAPEKESRSTAIAGAATRAASVPADVARAAAEVISLAERLLPIANRNVISDVAAAADAARAAATTARVNVEINLSSITDATTRESLILRISGVDELAARADTVTARVRKLLSQ